MVHVMVTEPPIKMDTPDCIPLIVIPIQLLVWYSCHKLWPTMNVYVPLHSGGLLQVAFA